LSELCLPQKKNKILTQSSVLLEKQVVGKLDLSCTTARVSRSPRSGTKLPQGSKLSDLQVYAFYALETPLAGIGKDYFVTQTRTTGFA
jgi:hypothetical protein